MAEKVTQKDAEDAHAGTSNKLLMQGAEPRQSTLAETAREAAEDMADLKRLRERLKERVKFMHLLFQMS